MKLPGDFAESAQRLPVKGYGGKTRGSFSVDLHSGEFTRAESRLAVFDPLFAANRGGASYSMQRAAGGDPVGAECRFKQNVLTFGVVTFDSKKFVFDCELSGNGNEPAGRLVLGEAKKEGFKQKLLAQAARRGAAEFGGTIIQIQSVHEYAGSRFTSQTPVGYLLTMDEAVVGALELTDVNPTIFLATMLDEQDRAVVLRAAVAVSLLRDPADSMLGD